jgi:hypothetical protein
MSTEPHRGAEGLSSASHGSGTQPQRARRLGTFFGSVMLLAQALVLWRFIQEVNREVEATPWVSAPALWSRLAWLKAPLWQPPWFKIYFVCLALLAAATALWLWIDGVRRAWRGWRAERGGA